MIYGVLASNCSHCAIMKHAYYETIYTIVGVT